MPLQIFLLLRIILFYCDFTIKEYIIITSLVAQMVKNLPARQETQVQSMGGKIP